MMSLATLPLSFWDYALESAACILNTVPTRKVDKTPYKLWHGKVPNLSYLKVWGCEAHVKCHTPDKLQKRSVKCIFVEYPKETMCYYFYYPPENKIVVERYANFLEKDFKLQKESERIIELEDEDILPSENTSELPIEEESLAPIVSQKEDVIPVHRSVRMHKAPGRLCLNVKIDPDRLCFNVEVEEHSLVDLNEPANYKAALSDPEFKKWLVAMNAEMQSMYDNKVWRLVVLPPNEKVVKSKWIYKKKTNMDGKVHIYKARLVAKGCTQTYGVDYYETFSPIADIRAIRILIAIAAYYDYEIWKYVSFKDLFMDLSKHQEARIRDLMRKSKKMKRMQNVLYALDVGSIMYVVRCTRLDVAFAQNITNRFQQNSGEAHWTAVKNILKYLRNTKDMFLVYGGDSKAELRVNCYCDARFKTDKDDTKSQTGKFIDELGVVPSNDYPIKMNCDNSAVIIMAKELGIHKGARHFKRKYHYVRECIETGKINIVKVHTDDNLADPFTKALAGPKLTRHARSMGLCPASNFM
nr:retrotransposon protein, putative, Ty1-copia subclass [Tanacetum cinerariifolium]